MLNQQPLVINQLVSLVHEQLVALFTWHAMIGLKLSSSSTRTRFFSGRGAKKKVSPSSSCIAEEYSGSPSSSPK